MKVTKYPQSCLLLEENGRRILIDPGGYFTEKYQIRDLPKFEAVLYTHQHEDHFDPDIVDELKSLDIKLYGNASVCELIGKGAIEVKNSQSFEVAGISISAHDLPHCLMVDGSVGPPNTGYIIDGNLFHPGDGTEIEGVSAKTVAAPIAGPDISFRDANKLAQLVGASKLIPIHFDGFIADPEFFKMFNERFNLPVEVIVLKAGESVEL